MVDLPFNEEIVKAIANFRIFTSLDWLTQVAVFITNLGDIEAYIIFIAIIYFGVSKDKGYKLSCILTLSIGFNVLLKLIIQNPRPFVRSGETSKYTVGSEQNSYSTPSGHAQGVSTFWYSILKFFKSNFLTVLGISLTILVGFTRVYLGVHYLEDVLLGWAFGLGVAIVVFYYWNKLPKIEELYYVVGTFIFSIILVFTLGFLRNFDDFGFELVSFSGIFAGLVLGRILELKYARTTDGLPSEKRGIIKFASQKFTSTWIVDKNTVSVVKIIIGIVITIICLFALDIIFEFIAEDDTFLGYALRYIRYVCVSLTLIFVSPFVFGKLGLVGQKNVDAKTSETLQKM